MLLTQEIRSHGAFCFRNDLFLRRRPVFLVFRNASFYLEGPFVLGNASSGIAISDCALRGAKLLPAPRAHVSLPPLSPWDRYPGPLGPRPPSRGVGRRTYDVKRFDEASMVALLYVRIIMDDLGRRHEASDDGQLT